MLSNRCQAEDLQFVTDHNRGILVSVRGVLKHAQKRLDIGQLPPRRASWGVVNQLVETDYTRPIGVD
jgi:hypothetical protein